MVKSVIVIVCLMVLWAAGASFAGLGTITDPSYETGSGWDDGSAGVQNTWMVSGPWDANRVRLEGSGHWGAWNLTPTNGINACMVDPGGSGGGTGAVRTTGYIGIAQDGWNTGSGNDPGDIMMAPGASYKIGVDVCTYGSLFNGGGIDQSTNWLGIGYAYETGNTWYWSSKNSFPNYAKVFDYATGANNYEHVTFTVTNSDQANAKPLVLGFIAAFGPGNHYGGTDADFWANNGYLNHANNAFGLVDNWTMQLVPEPASLLALGFGLIGLVGGTFRARRR